MAVGSGDLAKGIKTRWAASGLEGEFSSLWPAGYGGRHVALRDNRGAAGQPLPYCVLEVDTGNVFGRSSGAGEDEATTKREERQIPVTFRVFADQLSGRSSKDIAAELAGKILSVFGGHPTQAPKDVPLEHGGVLHFQYDSDYGIGEDDRVHQWVISYTARVDVPVATG